MTSTSGSPRRCTGSSPSARPTTAGPRRRATGWPLMFHLPIAIDDIDRFIADTVHQAAATGG